MECPLDKAIDHMPDVEVATLFTTDAFVERMAACFICMFKAEFLCV